MNRNIQTQYNSKYVSRKYRVYGNKPCPYTPLKEEVEVPFETPLFVKIPRNDEEFYILTITDSSRQIKKRKAFIYKATIEHFKKQEKPAGIPPGNINIFPGGASINYSTMWSFYTKEPELITDIKQTKSISHKTLKNYINDIIDETEYVKILLLENKLND